MSTPETKAEYHLRKEREWRAEAEAATTPLFKEACLEAAAGHRRSHERELAR